MTTDAKLIERSRPTENVTNDGCKKSWAYRLHNANNYGQCKHLNLFYNAP